MKFGIPPFAPGLQPPTFGGYSSPPPRMAPPIDPGQMPPPGYANYPRYGDYGPEVSPTKNDKAYGWVMFVFSVLGILSVGIGVFVLMALPSILPTMKSPLQPSYLIPLALGRVVLITVPTLFAGYFMTQGLRKAFLAALVTQSLQILYAIVYAILVSPTSLLGLIIPGIFLIYIIRRLSGELGPSLL